MLREADGLNGRFGDVRSFMWLDSPAPGVVIDQRRRRRVSLARSQAPRFLHAFGMRQTTAPISLTGLRIWRRVTAQRHGSNRGAETCTAPNKNKRRRDACPSWAVAPAPLALPPPGHLHHDPPLHPAPRFPDQADRSSPKASDGLRTQSWTCPLLSGRDRCSL